MFHITDNKYDSLNPIIVLKRILEKYFESPITIINVELDGFDKARLNSPNTKYVFCIMTSNQKLDKFLDEVWCKESCNYPDIELLLE